MNADDLNRLNDGAQRTMAFALDRWGAPIEKVREEVEKLVPRGRGASSLRQIPFTPRAKKALETSIQEAKGLGHTAICAEHLLLGIIRQADATASKALAELGVKLEDLRKQVMESMGGGPSD